MLSGIEIGMIALVVTTIAVIVSRFVVYAIRIESDSMHPSLQSGDLKLVNKLNKNYQRGDILIFYTEEYGRDFVKRLIGLPGDKIDIQNGQVFVNGNLLNEPYAINNSVYRGNFVVPEENFFFLGDNREASTDSRSFENPYISVKDIKGKVLF